MANGTNPLVIVCFLFLLKAISVLISTTACMIISTKATAIATKHQSAMGGLGTAFALPFVIFDNNSILANNKLDCINEQFAFAHSKRVFAWGVKHKSMRCIVVAKTVVYGCKRFAHNAYLVFSIAV